MADQPTHLDADGAARMVDVSAKSPTVRSASAVAFVYLSPDSYDSLRRGDSAKGDVVSTARIAGIMGAKRTGDLIPLCHPLALTDVDVRFAWLDSAHALAIKCSSQCVGPTGVEMEAITGASIAALTVYDMVKGIDRAAYLGDIHVTSKSGGKSGEFVHRSPPGPDLASATWT